MVVFWNTPRKVQIAKIVAIVITTLLLIFSICGLFYGSFGPSETKWASFVALIFPIVFDVIFTIVICLECKCCILLALILFAIQLIGLILLSNFLFIDFCVSILTTYKQKLQVNNETDAFWIAVKVEILLLSVLILYAIRYYAVLIVYRWSRIPRISANVTSSGPRITPQIFCFQTRYVVIFFSISGLIECLWQTVFNGDLVTKTTGVISAVLEVVLLYGVIKNQSKLLRISMYISLIHLAIDFGGILVTPVYFASQVASGYESNDTYPNILGVKTAEEDRFVMGLVTGYSVEIITTAGVALSILQFVLINRCYVYAKSMEKGFLTQSKLSVLRF